MMMKKEETIRLKHLSTGYAGRKGPKIIAADINATLCSGELTCLIGANGAGKSTLLRTLSAFLPPLAGEVWLLGRRLEDYTDKQLAKVIGVVLTEKCHLRNMSVADLIGMGRSPYTGFWGSFRPEDYRIVEEALRLVGIEALKERKVETLSDGERQKVMIAKALAQETPIIFLDEPTAYLDYPSKVDILHLLHRLSREMNKTIFLSTHDLELALQIADQLWLMDRQQGIWTGTPEDLALDGRLDGFFQARGIVFDSNTGLYRMDQAYTEEVRLEGTGCRAAMVQKALRRNGIRAHSEARSTCCIRTGEGTDFQLLDHEGRVTTVRTIRELITTVENLLKQP